MILRNDRKNLKKFEGEWVAFNKNEVIAHGNHPEPVYQKALKVCKRPTLFLVPENLDLEFI